MGHVYFVSIYIGPGPYIVWLYTKYSKYCFGVWLIVSWFGSEDENYTEK